MTSKLRWSLVLLALGLMAAGLYAQTIVGQGPQGRIEYNPRSDARQPGLIDPVSGDSMLGREWEGIASTDYLEYEAYIMAPPNPQVATGPDHILTVVNRTILAYPNPNAGGSTTPIPSGGYWGPEYPVQSRTVLTQWIGEMALNELCPTLPRTNVSCVINNASVTYDQMQGRYVVLFTATDTLARRAHWVLIVSAWATFPENTSGVPSTNPIFTTPQPPGLNQDNPNSGGVNANWYMYYEGPSTAALKHNTNINAISDYVLKSTALPDLNCAAKPAVNDPTPITGFCYFPSSARLGLTNDDIVVTSAVYNDNIPPAERTAQSPAFRGTRVRVYKKAAIYIGVSSIDLTSPIKPGIAIGNPGALDVATQGDYYDLWCDGASFTVDPNLTGACAPNGEPEVPAVAIFYEPAHLRGRALANYSGKANRDGGFTTLVGAAYTPTDSVTPRQELYLRSIEFTQMRPGSIASADDPPGVDKRVIQGGIPKLLGRQSVSVPPFVNPQDALQRARLTQPSEPNDPPVSTPSPNLWVGDNRPHRVIAREGHLYLARVANVGNTANRFDPTNPMGTTVVYDIVQKLSNTGTPFNVQDLAWQNGRFFAPMFDIPANVIQYGSISPINQLPYLEKLFVGTTFPPIAPTDPRVSVWKTWGYLSSKADLLAACTGMEPSVRTSVAAYPGLYDVRCGEDAYSTSQLVRNPYTGAEVGIDPKIYPWGQRGGASTDPNTMGMWVYGAYAKGSAAQITGPGQWGTYVAYYPLSFPPRDPYNNRTTSYADAQPGHPFYTYIQIAKQTEIEPGARNAVGNFGVDEPVKRKDMAVWVIRSQMDDAAVDAYLATTGGTDLLTFSDVNKTAHAKEWKYIEVMARRGYTKGCSATNDGTKKFCPEDNLTRGQMAVFLIRAKMNSVFPTVESGASGSGGGCPATGGPAVGDMFGLFASSGTKFTDIQTHPFCTFIAKLRELRISNGKSPTLYAPDDNITRGELMVFVVRAFFP